MQSESTMMQDLFDLYKKQLLEKIDAISIFDEAQDYHDQWKRVSETILSIDKLMDIRQDLSIESSSYFSPPLETESIPDIEEEEENQYFVFKRKLRGGIVLMGEEDYFIPEQMVRDMGLSHDDLVKSGVPYTHENRIRRNFSVVEKRNLTNENRVQLTEFVVSKTSRGLCLVHDTEGTSHLLESGEPYTFCISKSDINDYNLKENDIVDAAYYKNNPEGFSIIFKHNRPSSYNYSDFKAVLYAEFNPNTSSHVKEQKEALEKLGFEVMLVHGAEMSSTINQMIRKSHVLVIDNHNLNSRIGMLMMDFFLRKRKVIIKTPATTAELVAKIKEHDTSIRNQL